MRGAAPHPNPLPAGGERGQRERAGREPRLGKIVSELALIGRNDLGPRLEAWLDALESWDESGRAPEVLLGGGPNAMVRPHCAWPDVARYRGTGDANDPANWQCVARS